MSIRYEITRLDWIGASEARSHIVRYRSPAARDALYREIYAMLESDGALDTLRGWKMVRQFDKCDTSAPPIGHGRFERFSLRPEQLDGGPVVEFRAYRIETEAQQ